MKLLLALLLAAGCRGQDAQQPLHAEGSSFGPWKDKEMKDLENFIEDKMKEWHVPGMAVAIVDGNSTWMKVRTL